MTAPIRTYRSFLSPLRDRATTVLTVAAVNLVAARAAAEDITGVGAISGKVVNAVCLDWQF
jgi:hypothetical protein